MLYCLDTGVWKKSYSMEPWFTAILSSGGAGHNTVNNITASHCVKKPRAAHGGC